MHKANKLYVVIPCYNEEEVLPETARRIRMKMDALKKAGKISQGSRVLFVNDGSRDKTLRVMEQLHEEDKLFSCVNLSRNRGHQNALLAGLMYAREHADMVVSMDADLQDDMNAMDKMIDAYHDGYDVVYGVRSSRKTDTFFKRFTAESFYHLMKKLGVDIVFNHADYRLMSSRALNALAEYGEVNLFLRGIVPQVGFPSTTVEYERNERFAGESKYPLKKMLSFAFDGISSFSVKPMRMILMLGGGIFTISLLMLAWTLLSKLFGYTTDGWASMMASMWMLGGIQLLSLGVIGEYIGKIYSETKRRPRYIIERVLDEAEETEE